MDAVVKIVPLTPIRSFSGISSDGTFNVWPTELGAHLREEKKVSSLENKTKLKAFYVYGQFSGADLITAEHLKNCINPISQSTSTPPVCALCSVAYRPLLPHGSMMPTERKDKFIMKS